VSDYGLDPMFERIVAQMLATNPAFYRRVGKHLSTDIIQDSAAKTVIDACRINRQNSGPPSSSVIVRQRLRSIHDAGKLSEKELRSALELLDDADDDVDAYNSEDILAELTPVLQRHAQKDALESALDTFSKRGDLGRVTDMLSQALRIGASDNSLGSKLSSDVVSQIEELRNAQKLSTGISELDASLSGGLDKGSLGFFVGASGSGKSMSLAHVASEAVSNGRSVAYATLELAEVHVHSRIMSNLTDICWEDIVNDPRSVAKAKTRLEVLEEDGLLGFCTVRYFTPHATTMADIRQWVKEEEEAYGKHIELICIDYVALLSAPDKKAKHEELTDIAESLRSLAVDRKCWVWSAAQVKSSAHDHRNKKITSDQAAGSMGISRTADLVITLNPRDEGATLMFRIDKNRHGRGGEDIGPLPHEFEKGRVCPVYREGWPF
jgi:KaiC/GvpD/RAD55 family RecA-like ATPase